MLNRSRAGYRPFQHLILAGVVWAVGCGGPSETPVGPVSDPGSPQPQSSTNVLTFHNDAARTGQNLTETVLTHANVNVSSFGKLLTLAVDAKVDAQPLYVSRVQLSDQSLHSVVYAATERDSVYGFDAQSGSTIWHVSLLMAGETPSDDLGCNQVTPEIGVTATPVIDLTAGMHGTLYALAMSKDRLGGYHHRLHALDIVTGEEEFGGPIEISAAYPGTGDNSSNGQVVFDPRFYNSRPGLLLLNGTIYSGWGSHCDFRPYTGWLIGYDHLTLKQTKVFNFTPNGSEAALWNSGGGIAADTTAGRIYIASGNGTFDTTLDTQGFPLHSDFGNCFVRLNALSDQLIVEDYWTMSDTVAESAQDKDLGSGGVLLLPDLKGSAGQTVQLGTGAGKDGKLYVFNRANMGKFNAQNDGTLYQELAGSLGGVVFATPAWFNGTLYYGAVGDRIRAFNMNTAIVSAQPASTTNNFFEYPGATPAISANGTSNAILWAVENANPAVLHAYDAANLGNELYNSNEAASGRDSLGPGNKFIVPIIADGRVFVGTTNSVVVFGLLQ